MDSATVEKAISSAKDRFPVQEATWVVETGMDATDDEAVWVWVTLPDADLTKENRDTFRTLLKQVIREVMKSTVLVYVRFRAVSEIQPA